MRINIIGAGSLGSFTALLLSKMGSSLGWELKLYDFDSVEKHNLQNQLFRKDGDIGKKKVVALKEVLSLFSDIKAGISDEKVANLGDLSGVVIILVDSMKSRREIFEAIQYCAHIPLLIEARSGGDVATIYAFDPRDIDNVRAYERTLYWDSEAVAAPCANAQEVDIIFQIASLIGKLVSLFQKKKLNGFVEALINYEGLPSISINAKIADIRKLFGK